MPDQQPKPKPLAGVVRATHEAMRGVVAIHPSVIDELSEIIQRESGISALVEACQLYVMMRTNGDYVVYNKDAEEQFISKSEIVARTYIKTRIDSCLYTLTEGHK